VLHQLQVLCTTVTAKHRVAEAEAQATKEIKKKLDAQEVETRFLENEMERKATGRVTAAKKMALPTTAKKAVASKKARINPVSATGKSIGLLGRKR
jgi:hypothetical protein